MNGTIIRVLGDKRFGFIHGEDNVQYFFHQTDFNGFFDDLVADVSAKQKSNIKVTFDQVQSDRGPRAGNVTRVDAGVLID